MYGAALFDWLAEDMRQGQISRAVHVLAGYLAGCADRDAASERLWHHPLMAFLREDPFTRRAMARPMAGAQDPQLVDLACDRVAPAGTSAVGAAMFAATVALPHAEAMRARREGLGMRLARAWAEGRRICGLGVGHFREGDALSGRDLTSVTLVDPDAGALARIRRKHGVTIVTEDASPWKFLQLSALRGERFDLIYAPSLADQLDEHGLGALYRAIRACLNPGGQALLTNLAPHPVSSGWSSVVARSHSFYRTGAALEDHARHAGFAVTHWAGAGSSVAFCEAVLASR